MYIFENGRYLNTADAMACEAQSDNEKLKRHFSSAVGSPACVIPENQILQMAALAAQYGYDPTHTMPSDIDIFTVWCTGGSTLKKISAVANEFANSSSWVVNDFDPNPSIFYTEFTVKATKKAGADIRERLSQVKEPVDKIAVSGGNRAVGACVRCGKPYFKAAPDQKYCTEGCREVAKMERESQRNQESH